MVRYQNILRVLRDFFSFFFFWPFSIESNFFYTLILSFSFLFSFTHPSPSTHGFFGAISYLLFHSWKTFFYNRQRTLVGTSTVCFRIFSRYSSHPTNRNEGKKIKIIILQMNKKTTGRQTFHENYKIRRKDLYIFSDRIPRIYPKLNKHWSQKTWVTEQENSLLFTWLYTRK